MMDTLKMIISYLHYAKDSSNMQNQPLEQTNKLDIDLNVLVSKSD